MQHRLASDLEIAEFPDTWKAIKTKDGHLLGGGDAVPTDGTSGFAPNAVFINKGGAAGSSLLTNEGTKSASAFKTLDTTVTSASLADFTLTTVAAPASTTTALTSAHSGKIVLMAPNAAAITLPAAAEGLNYTIIQTGDYSTAANTITQAASGEDFFGVAVSGELSHSGDTDTAVVANTLIGFGSNSKKGDRVELVSDGTSWYFKSYARLNDGITFET